MPSRFRIALNTHLLDDAKRAQLVTGIQKVAPQSPLAQTPSVATSLAALGTKGATLATDANGSWSYTTAPTQNTLLRALHQPAPAASFRAATSMERCFPTAVRRSTRPSHRSTPAPTSHRTA